ncbi:hypothetical protein QFC20_006605 [Naganishia adeliensis]|uniref:Uncharacterized protein n=1 Tax=Naganishia adeliensis TaxID=92952 RepID=A0ACC2V869_9TREE|nr:hypothetical protein QFC20_006605 [Naganishia adeliensis]
MFDFIKGFFTRDEEEVEFKGIFDYDDLRDLELRCSVILAYCIKHGLDSAEEFVKSVVKFDVVQLQMTCMCRDPAAWNEIPTYRLNSRAASVLMQGCEQFKAGRQEEFRKIKEDFEKPVPEPTAEIVYGELPGHIGLWSLYERKMSDETLTKSKKPFPKSRTPEILKTFLKDFGIQMDKADLDSNSLCSSGSEGASQSIKLSTSASSTSSGSSSIFKKGTSQSAGSRASSQAGVLRTISDFFCGLPLGSNQG